MESTTWQVILHEIGTIIAGVAAVIAALSSLRNGQRLKNGNHQTSEVGQRAKRKAMKKETPAVGLRADWYDPPKLG